MSDSEGYEAVTVTEEGVTVTKRFEADEFPVPAIAFDVDSDRGETVRLTLREQVPEGVAVEDLGFHPEYGSEHWTIEDDEITFERDIEPGAEYTTVYGIRATGTDNVERFLDEPQIEQVDPPREDSSSDGADVLPEDGDDVVRDVISGETDSVPGVDEEPEESEEAEEVEPIELNDPGSESGTVAETTAAPDSERGTGPGQGTESVLEALMTELETEDEDTVAQFRTVLGVDDEPDGSITARVDRIQRDVSNLRAYTDALEEFLDEEGTADEIIDDVQSKLEDLESVVEDVESTVEANESTLSSVEERLEETNDTVEDLETSVTSLETDVEDLRETVEEGDVADRLKTVEGDLEDLREWQTQIKQTFGGE